MMIFLGSGASEPFGIPTMSNLMDKFEMEVLESRPEDEKLLYNKIKKCVSPELEINMEDILTTLNSLSKIAEYQRTSLYFDSILKRIRNELGDFESEFRSTVGSIQAPFGIFRRLFRRENALKTLNDELKNVSKRREEVEKGCSLIDPHISENLRAELIEFIRKSCFAGEIRAIRDVYDSFFGILDIDKISKIDIFTTNYDCCIENYFGSREERFCDGFRYDKFKREEYWDPGEYDKCGEKFRLFKLHGSVDYYISEMNEIVKTTSAEKLGRHRNVMVYPIRDVRVDTEPLFELFGRLRKCLLDEKICIVIGYSFSDNLIRERLFDAVKRNSKIKIILINPIAVTLTQDVLQPINNNITPINGKFGKERVFNELDNEIQRINRKLYIL